jgi:hypothetical protein
VAAQTATELRHPSWTPRRAAVGNASEQVVNRHLVAVALGRLSQEHRDVLRALRLAIEELRDDE